MGEGIEIESEKNKKKKGERDREIWNEMKEIPITRLIQRDRDNER